jgi:hypothetical protein
VFNRKVPEPPPDPRLDPYRHAAALVFDGDESVGCLAIRVTGWWERSGPFWRRRWENGRELPWWGLLRTAPAHPALPGEFEDGIVPDDMLEDELRDWAADVFTVRGTRFRLRWLAADEAGAVHRDIGWDE